VADHICDQAWENQASKYTSLCYGTYISPLLYVQDINSVNFAIKFFINGRNFIELVILSACLKFKNEMKFCVHISSCRITFYDCRKCVISLELLQCVAHSVILSLTLAIVVAGNDGSNDWWWYRIYLYIPIATEWFDDV